MACKISFKDRSVQMNNRQFSNLLALTLEYAQNAASSDEKDHVVRMAYLHENEFWPGRGVQLEEDFPETNERKFWSKMLFDTARAVFNREVGNHDHSYWQVQAIHQIYSTGLLFEHAVQQIEPKWYADTLDRAEFNQVVNGT
ncbi:hypothetical protein [Gimesia algae]|uniref:Uncharacterized protein n=1 Tax=Gimesia algae TaxID=2527971 RepID=A0A517V5W3_9PLAN|nr:hypothetical protein [Gimesia algae]QDT88402.1 hypothetical protein Pan161_00180 [Gimesia algae]